MSHEKRGASEPSESQIIDFIFTIGKLKQTPRTGWTRYPIPEPESVGDHIFRAVTMGMLLASTYNAEPVRATQMLILHDLAEALIGDIVTDGGATDLSNKAQKLIEERAALEEMLARIDAAHYMEIYDEFAENKTPTAQFANAIDGLEMASQAREYEIAHGVELDEFYTSARRRINVPGMDDLLSQIINRDK